MQSFFHIYSTIGRLERFIKLKKIHNMNNVLIQVYTTEYESLGVMKFIEILKSLLPKAVLMGCSTTGLIVKHKYFEAGTLVCFWAFEHTSVKTASVAIENGWEAGRKVISDLDSSVLKVILLYTAGAKIKGPNLLKGIESIREDVLLTGCRVSGEEASFVFTDEGVLENGVVAVGFSGDPLKAYVGYSDPWQPFGSPMTVTEAAENRLISLDGIPIKEVYRKYFGQRFMENLVRNALFHPLYGRHELVGITKRVVKEYPEYLELNTDVEIGEKLNFTIFNQDYFYVLANATFEKYGRMDMEGCFLFYSRYRQQLLKTDAFKTELATSAYSNIPTFGIICEEEYYHSVTQCKNYIFSHSITDLFLNENENKSSKGTYKLKRLTKISDRLKSGFELFEENPLLHFVGKVMEENRLNHIEVSRTRDMLLEKDKLASIGQLMGGIAHNLNTPIMGASGQIMLMNKKLAKIAQRLSETNHGDAIIDENLDELKTHANNIEQYLFYMSDVLSTVKSQIRTQENVRIGKFSLEDLFEKTIYLMSFKLKKNKITINRELEENIRHHELEGDITALIQILINLIENSIDSYGEKPGAIDLKASFGYQFPGLQPFVKISVKDYGCGMNEAVKEKLIKQMVTTKGTRGTGIGVYVSNILLKAKFDGFIDFKSQKDMGTLMEIYIPY